MISIQVDARCLQDDAYRYRGIGQHSATLLRQARKEFAATGGVRLIGILDRRAQSLAHEHAALFDDVTYSPKINELSDWFLSLSPMTHSPIPFAQIFLTAPKKLAAILYDFIPIEFPERYLSDSTSRHNYLTWLRWLEYYSCLACISQHASESCERFIPGSKADRYVTGVAVRTKLSGTQASTAARGGTHFLVVAGGDFRKNAECPLLAHAHSEIARLHKTPMIIVGGYDVSQLDSMRALYSSAGGNTDLLQFRSGVSDEDLAALYQHAVLTICPSRSEGFSIPVIEANANNCPVIISNCPAQTELIPFEQDQFSPDDFLRVARLMDEAMLGPQARSDRMRRQQGIWRSFDENSVARRFWGPFKKKTERAKTFSFPAVQRGARPKVAFVSPLPPEQSGVADYAGVCLESLVQMADVHVFTDTVAANAPTGIRSLKPVSPLPYLSGDFDAIVSAVGNSHFHLSTIDLVLDYGGAAVIHDARLINFYSILHGPERATRIASRELGRTVAWPEVERWLHSQRHLPTLFLSELLDAAHPSIVHSRGTQGLIKQLYDRETHYLPFAPQRVLSEDACSARVKSTMRSKLGIAHDVLLVSTFGGLIPDKAPEECLWTLDRLKAWGLNAHLAFVGMAGKPMADHLRRLSALLELSDRVHIFEGYVGEEVYSAFLAASDIGLQLRTHGLGSISGALMDCITSGLPTVANVDLAEALDAPDYVYRTSDSLSPVLIAEAILQSIEASSGGVRPLDKRREFLEARNFDRYNTAMLQALGVA